MKLRFIGTMAISCCLVAATARGGEPDVKPIKKTFRAADGANIVGEVRGKGETAIVFLHGWGGDRAYAIVRDGVIVHSLVTLLN